MEPWIHNFLPNNCNRATICWFFNVSLLLSGKDPDFCSPVRIALIKIHVPTQFGGFPSTSSTFSPIKKE